MPPLKRGGHFALLLSICPCRFICRSLILLRLLVWKVYILFSSVLVSFQVSHPCSNTDKTRLLKRETLVFLPISMAFQPPEGCASHCYSLPGVSPALTALCNIGPKVYKKLSTSSASLFSTVRLALLFLFIFSTLHFLYLVSSHICWVVFQLCCLELLNCSLSLCNVIHKVKVFKHGGEVPVNSWYLFFDHLLHFSIYEEEEQENWHPSPQEKRLWSLVLHHRAMEVIIQGFDLLNQFLGFSIYLINDKP